MSGSLIEKHLGRLPPVLSRRLCETAGSANDQLTTAERLLLLGRLDLAGLALACPSALTDAQLDQLRGRPPPAVLARIVRAATGLDSVPAVVVAAAAAAAANGEYDLGREAMEVVTGGWWTFETFRVYGEDEEGEEEEEEAAWVAAERVAEALRPGETDFEAEVAFRFCGMEGEGEGVRMEEAEMAEGELQARREQHLAGRAREREALRATLREQLERELAGAAEGDLLALREVRARMAVEVAEEEREDWERQRKDEEGMVRGMRMLEVEEED